MDSVFPYDIQIMYEIKLKLDILKRCVDENKTNMVDSIKQIQENDEEKCETTKETVKINKLQEKWENFKHIHNCITEYIENHCHHKFIDDYIDTSPESGMNIRYCIHCYKSG